MRIKKVELNNFKRFTHLTVENIPETAKLIVLVGPNGCGKTSFFEAMNHYYKYSGYQTLGDYHYLLKSSGDFVCDNNDWYYHAQKIVDIDFYNATFSKTVGKGDIKGHFYFRSAYRNEPYFQINSMQKQPNPIDTVRLSSLIDNDAVVSVNYQRLIGSCITGLYDENNDGKTVAELRNELVGKIQTALEHVFGDLKLTSLGKPLENGNFYFTKGTTENFSYRNLSAGEKSAFDLILDIVVQSQYYSDAVYCIDEPETHMHTKLQGRVLRELYSLMPDNSQLWISTHSMGMLQEAMEIEKKNHGTVAFLEFSERDFDTDQIIVPSKIGKTITEKFYELAFGDFAKLILPETIVFCEGCGGIGKRKDFDKSIYTTIFSDNHPEVIFISSGSCSDIEKLPRGLFEILLRNTKIIRLIDRDDCSQNEIAEFNDAKITVLKERNIESYLLDDEVIAKLCESVGKVEAYEECIEEKKKALNNSIARGNPSDDLKSARGEIYNSIKRILGLTKCGNNADTFIRDTLSPLIKSDMNVYKRLENEIFGE